MGLRPVGHEGAWKEIPEAEMKWRAKVRQERGAWQADPGSCWGPAILTAA